MDYSQIKPIQDQVLIKIDEHKKTFGNTNLVIPDNYRDADLHDTVKTGVVIAVGPGTRRSPMTVKVGDHIFWDSTSQPGVNMGEGHTMVRCTYIKALIC